MVLLFQPLVGLGFCLFSFSAVDGIPNGLAKTPQMGWNSWNRFGCNINEDIMKSTMELLIYEGLADAGYIYANIDDCWQRKRESSGEIMADETSFPSGMASLAAFAHAKGLKFGLYSDAGRKTCAGRPGSLGYEQIDATTYAEWGVDYLKYDNCFNEGEPMKDRYTTMGDALNDTGRPILYSMCSWGLDDVNLWGNTTGNSWRTTGDINDTWASMLWNWDNNGPASSAGPGGWNDPDMLEVGNGGMTDTEYKTHFSLWCIGKAPLIIGCDLNAMSAQTKSILLNKEAIAVNQDPLGVQASPYSCDDQGNCDVYAGPLDNKEYAVALFNRGDNNTNMTLSWLELGLERKQNYTVRDLWLHEDVGVFNEKYSADVESHGVVFLKMTPA